MFHANYKSTQEDVTTAEAARPPFVEYPSGSPVIGVPESGWKPSTTAEPSPTMAAKLDAGYHPVTNSEPQPVPSAIGIKSPSYLDVPPRPVHTRVSMVEGIAPEVALYAPEVRKAAPKQAAPPDPSVPVAPASVASTAANDEPVLVELTADSTAAGPYAAAADWYRSRGWEGILPLPPGKKTWPPGGFTGKGGAMPTAEQIEAWKVSKGNGNLALRLPRGIISIDVDGGYIKDGKLKAGNVQLAKLEAELGEKLPPTWIATSRAPQLSPLVSGKRFYRLPEGFTGELRDLTGDLDLLHFGYRYAAVWPSTNPDNGGAVNRWYCQVPGMEFTPDALPVIGPKWLAHMTSTAPRSSGSKPTTGRVASSTANPDDQWIVDACLTPGEPSAALRRTLEKKLEQFTFESNRHKNALREVNWALGVGAEGNPGAAWAVAQLRHSFAHGTPSREGAAHWETQFDKFLEPTPALIEKLRDVAARHGRIIGEMVADGITEAPTAHSEDDAWFEPLTEPDDHDAGNGGKDSGEAQKAEYLEKCGEAIAAVTEEDPNDDTDGKAKAAAAVFMAAANAPELLDGIFCTDLLKEIRRRAQRNLVSPWVALGANLSGLMSVIPYDVVLPRLVGKHTAPLNSIIINVDESGGGKAGQTTVDIHPVPHRWTAEDQVLMGEPPSIPTILQAGSGEAISAAYSRVTKGLKVGTWVSSNHTESMWFAWDEVTKVLSVRDRKGSTIEAELCLLWAAERLGSKTKTDPAWTEARSYRAVASIAAQLVTAAGLLTNEYTGLVQRLLWLSAEFTVSDEEAAKRLAELDGDDDEVWVDTGETDKPIEIRLPEWPSNRQIPVVRAVVREIQAQRLEHGKGNKLHAWDRHTYQMRMRYAAAAAIMHGECMVTKFWWDWAGLLMTHSGHVRAAVETLRHTAQVKLAADAGKADAVRAANKDTAQWRNAVNSTEQWAARRDRFTYSQARTAAGPGFRQENIGSILDGLVGLGRLTVETEYVPSAKKEIDYYSYTGERGPSRTSSLS